MASRLFSIKISYSILFTLLLSFIPLSSTVGISSRWSLSRLLRMPFNLLDADLGAISDLNARGTRLAIIEQLQGVLRRPVYAIGHDIALEELRGYSSSAQFRFPVEVFEALPYTRTNTTVPVEEEPPVIPEPPVGRFQGVRRFVSRVLRGSPTQGELYSSMISSGASRRAGEQAVRGLLASPGYSVGIFFDGAPNFALLVHSALTLSLAAYSLHVDGSGNTTGLLERGVLRTLDQLTASSLGSGKLPEARKVVNTERARLLARYAAGRGADDCAMVDIQLLRSDRACGFSVLDSRHRVLSVVFRGTLDPIDVLTDAAFLPAAFASRTASADTELVVHRGFLEVFLTLLPDLEAIVDAAGEDVSLLFTGHSMGGALAQLAAAYFADRKPFLVTFGAPCIGTASFQRHLTESVKPHGGIRIWNELDTIPYLAQAVGYNHAGLPVKLSLSRETKVPPDHLPCLPPSLTHSLGRVGYRRERTARHRP